MKEHLVKEKIPYFIAAGLALGSYALAVLSHGIENASAQDATLTPTASPTSTPLSERVHAPIVAVQKTQIAIGVQLMTPTTPTPSPTATAEPTSTPEPTATYTPEPTPTSTSIPELVIPVRRIYTPEDTLAAIGQTPLRIRDRVYCVVYYEVGRGLSTREGVLIYAPWDPNSVGAQEEEGPVQLHPRGKLPVFYRRGYDNPRNPYQAIPFLVEELDNGQGNAWAGINRGWC